MTDTANTETPPAAGWRFKLGVVLFVIGLVAAPILLPLLAFVDLSTELKATLSGGILIASELLWVTAAAVMGKSGFAQLKGKLFAILKRYGPPEEVSRTRYLIGLAMFVAPLLHGFLAPYASDMVPGYEANELTISIVSDLVLLASLFVLGGEFWEKLRSLFVHRARAVVPEPTAQVATADRGD